MTTSVCEYLKRIQPIHTPIKMYLGLTRYFELNSKWQPTCNYHLLLFVYWLSAPIGLSRLPLDELPQMFVCMKSVSLEMVTIDQNRKQQHTTNYVLVVILNNLANPQGRTVYEHPQIG